MPPFFNSIKTTNNHKALYLVITFHSKKATFTYKDLFFTFI